LGNTKGQETIDKILKPTSKILHRHSEGKARRIPTPLRHSE